MWSGLRIDWVNDMTIKPIYYRKIWSVLEEAAKELRMALDHTSDHQVKDHIQKAINTLDKYVMNDMKEAEKCQRNRESG